MPRTPSYPLPELVDLNMKRLKLDIRALAKEAGLKEQMLYNNLRGQKPMSLGTALKLIKVFGYSEDVQAVLLLIQIHEQHLKYKKTKKKKS